MAPLVRPHVAVPEGRCEGSVTAPAGREAVAAAPVRFRALMSCFGKDLCVCYVSVTGGGEAGRKSFSHRGLMRVLNPSRDPPGTLRIHRIRPCGVGIRPRPLLVRCLRLPRPVRATYAAAGPIADRLAGVSPVSGLPGRVSLPAALFGPGAGDISQVRPVFTTRTGRQSKERGGLRHGGTTGNSPS